LNKVRIKLVLTVAFLLLIGAAILSNQLKNKKIASEMAPLETIYSQLQDIHNEINLLYGFDHSYPTVEPTGMMGTRLFICYSKCW